MKRPSVIIPFTLLAALSLAGCSAPAAQTAPVPSPEATTEVEVDAPEEEAPAEESFVDGVLTTDEVTIEITDWKVIEAGEKGNEYGDNPVLAIWYDTTNPGTADRDVTPMDFLYNFEAFQDNDPNRENTLDVASLPDDQFLESQMENIKAGGTVANAIAYSLDDLTTPVDLVAGNFGMGDEIGRMTFKLG